MREGLDSSTMPECIFSKFVSFATHAIIFRNPVDPGKLKSFVDKNNLIIIVLKYENWIYAVILTSSILSI